MTFSPTARLDGPTPRSAATLADTKAKFAAEMVRC